MLFDIKLGNNKKGDYKMCQKNYDKLATVDHDITFWPWYKPSET